VATKTLASVALARVIQRDGEARRPAAGTEGPAERRGRALVRERMAGGAGRRRTGGGRHRRGGEEVIRVKTIRVTANEYDR
jgi:hypothetical protein